MVDPDVLSRRLLALNEALAHLRSHPDASDVDRLVADPVLKAAVERWLQVAIEACVDMAYHVIAERGWTPPASGREAFTTLASHGLVPVELARRLGLAVGLRNVLVHDYADVDLTILAGAVEHDLDDLGELGACVGALLGEE